MDTAKATRAISPGWDVSGGEYWKNGGDKDTQTFESDDILYDPAVSFEDLQGRVWFGNALCFSDDDTYSPCPKDPGDPTDPGVIIIKWSSHIVIDCNLGSIFYLLLTADAILDPLVNAKHCKPIILIVQQDERRRPQAHARRHLQHRHRHRRRGALGQSRTGATTSGSCTTRITTRRTWSLS